MSTLHEDCCHPVPSVAPGDEAGDAGAQRATRRERWALGGAVLAALLSSACCWLPLGLVLVGLSAGGLAGFFESYRWLFLGVTGALLATGFYLVYFRKPKCAPGEACAVPRPRLRRVNQILLWIATVVVLAFALFPNYVGLVLR